MIKGSVWLQDRNDLVLTAVLKTETFSERTKGLLGTDKLCDEEGMLITPCNSVHSFFMKFSFDVLYLDKDSTVIKMVESMLPWRLSWCMRSVAVLEGPAGFIKKENITLGSKLVWEKN